MSQMLVRRAMTPSRPFASVGMWLAADVIRGVRMFGEREGRSGRWAQSCVVDDVFWWGSVVI
jgi:hypothetical protein